MHDLGDGQAIIDGVRCHQFANFPLVVFISFFVGSQGHVDSTSPIGQSQPLVQPFVGGEERRHLKRIRPVLLRFDVRREWVRFMERRLEFVLQVSLDDSVHVRFIEQAETKEPFQFCLRRSPRMDHMTRREDGLAQFLDLLELFRALCRQVESFEEDDQRRMIVLNEFDLNQGRIGLLRCWSCLTLGVDGVFLCDVGRT